MLRAALSVTPRLGIAVPGSTACGKRSQVVRLSGVLASFPAI